MNNTETAKFDAPAAKTETPLHSATLTLTAYSSGSNINISYTATIGKDLRSRVFTIFPLDDDTFVIPADLHQSTQNMLIGIGQRLRQLQRWGFDREP